MARTISISLIAAGVVLVILGVRAYDSVSSDFSRFFTDSPTDKAIWLLIAGAAALMVGLGGTVRGRLHST